MSMVNKGDSTLPIGSLLMKHKPIAVKRKFASRPIYKVALMVGDASAAIVAFILGLWLAGWSNFLWNDAGLVAGFFILSLTTIAFFQTYHLYSYHYLFSRKTHLESLGKSFCWSTLTLILILFLFNTANLWEDNFYIFVDILLVGTVVFLILSRYLWRHLLDFLMAFGIAFFIVGMTGLTCTEGIPVFMANGLVISICFSLAVILISIVRITLVHVVFNKWLRRHFRRQVAVAGSNSEADRIVRYIVDHNAPFWVVGTVGPKSNCGLKNSLGKGFLGELDKLPNIVSQFKIDDIIITDEDIDKPTLVSVLEFCTSAGINAWFPPKLLPIINIKLLHDNFCGLTMFRLCSQKNTWLFSKIKHAFDALITFPMFILQLPLFLLIALAIKLESPGPVFYRAQAVGKNGRIFTMYKFRSMKVETGHEIHKDYVTKLIKGEITNGAGADKPLKITDDPRITRVGKLIRKLSLDELPQLINVLKGDMSLVGPRPCLPYEFEVYQDWYKRRVSVRSGISGLWQVTGRSEVSFEDMILLDLYYIYNRSFTMDFNILFETIFVVLGKKGAY